MGLFAPVVAATAPPKKKPYQPPPPPPLDAPPKPQGMIATVAAAAQTPPPVQPVETTPVHPDLGPHPEGPPVPVLSQIAGTPTSIQTFNQNLQAVTDQHVAQTGAKPDPTVALHSAITGAPSFPTLPAIASAQQAVQAHPIVPTIDTPQQLLDATKQAVKDGTYGTLVGQHYAELSKLNHDPKWAAKFAAVLSHSQGEARGPGDVTTDYGNPNIYGPHDTAVLNKAGMTFGTPLGLLGKAFGQVAESLVHAPGGLWQAGTAISLDLADAAHWANPFDTRVGGNLDFSRTQKLGAAVAAGYKRDFQHPYENPGFVFLDVLGFASVGASGVARLGAASRAEGLGGKVAALATKPRGGTVEIGLPGATEHAIISDNPLVGAIEKLILSQKQKTLLETRATGKAPAGIASLVIPQGIHDWLDQYFSFPTKIGREADARRRVEQIAQMTVARELDHVAGGAPIVARTYSRLPAALRNGLTRGENKAIQTVSFGVKPADQIAFHRNMIAQTAGLTDDTVMGGTGVTVGQFVKNHLRQIADLQLAQKVLDSTAPSDRFVKALALTRQVAAEMQQIKIDQLGLSPITAEGRLGKPAGAMGAADYVAKDGTLQPVAAAQEYPATGVVEPFYTKLEPRGKGKRPPSDRAGFFAPKAGPFGVAPPRPMPELTHEFTGKAINAGDFRVDAGHLTTEGYARTVRAATVLNEHARLWKAASDTQRTGFDLPIRDSQKIPDALRSAFQDMTDGSISAAEAEALPEDTQTLLKLLYPSAEEIARTPIEGVRWVDGRMMGDANAIPHREGAAVKVMSALNEPLRDATLFLRPAYALNLLGNVAMSVFHQGFSAVPSMARAIHWKDELGEQTVRTIDALMGQGRSKSYTSAIAPKVGQKLAQAWNVVTDQSFRRSSFLYEAKQLGYDSPAKIQQLIADNGKDLVEVKRRANKALVEFDNLTDFEKNTLRHIIFVYPWASRSAVWSIRAVMEHPMKTQVLAQLGREEADTDPLFKHVPQWFKATGYFPVSWNGDGTPMVVNPTSINTFSTLGDITNLFGAGLGATKYAALDNLFGPAAKIVEHALTGRDDFGNAYPDHQWLRAAEDVLVQLPQVSAFQRAGIAQGKNQKPLAKFSITDRSSLEARLNSALKHTVFTPGWLDGYGSLLAGGLSPRGEDPLAASARFWKDQTPEQRHGLELDLLQRALGLQANFLKTKVPAGVRTAVKLASDLTYEGQQFAKQNGRTATSKEKALMTLKYLGANGLVTAAEEGVLSARLKPLADDTTISTWTSHIVGRYAGGNALAQWDADVRSLYSFRRQVFAQKAAGLRAQGLVPVGPTPAQPDLYAYGRGYLDYTREAKRLAAQVTAGKATAADVRVFQDKHNQPVSLLPKRYMVAGTIPGLVERGNIDINHRPVAHNPDGSISTVRTISIGTDKGETLIPTVIGGKVVSDKAAIAYYDRTGENLGTFKSVAAANAYSVKLHDEQAKVYLHGGPPTLPSFAAMDWANTSPKSQQTQLHSIASASWKSLSGFEKSLVGVRVPPVVSAGWKDYDESVKQARDQYGRSLARNQVEYLVNAEDKQFPGFAKDWKFAQRPRVARFEATTLYKRMPPDARKAWDAEIGPSAKIVAAQFGQGTYTAEELRKAWSDYVTQDVPKYLDKHPALKRYLSLFNRGFLKTLEEK